MAPPSPTPARPLRRVALSAVPPLRRIVGERDDLRRRQGRLERRLAMQRRRIAALERQLQALETGAVPSNGGGPAPQLGYLFIVAYGRSGSTLLQGLLNSIPGYVLRGENRGALYRLYEYHATLLGARGQFARTADLTSRDSWYGIDEYADHAAISQMRALVLQTVLRPPPGTRVVGFKEIRWWQSDWQDYLAFLRKLFPGARFVLNTRDHDGVTKSKWWGRQPEAEVRAQLEAHEAQLGEMAGILGTDAYRVHYDDYVKDPDVLKGLFSWLGEPFDRAAVDEVLGVKHSF